MSGLTIYIAEKRALGEKVAIALGGGKATNGFIDGGNWRVYFCQGHILEMYEPKDYKAEWGKWNKNDLPMIPEQWKLKPKESVRHLLSLIEEGLKLADTVVNVGDKDREGQLLVDEVLEYFNWTGETKRLWPEDQTQSWITKNIENLQDNKKFIGFKNQALARGRADWLIGINSTRAYTINAKKHGADELLSIGRVQTPTLALIANRDKEISNFKSITFYEITGLFSNGKGDFLGKLVIDESLKNEHGYLIDEVKTKDIISNIKGDGLIGEVQKKAKNKNQPLCFSKSGLVEQCFKEFGYDGDKVLKIAQSLYDKEATTYPRTDCGYLPESKLELIPLTMENLAGIQSLKKIVDGADLSIKSHVWNDSKTTAHDGIIPTETMKSEIYDKLSEEEKKVFDIIALRYLAQFYEIQKSEETTFIVTVDENKFLVKGTVLINEGWTVLYPVKTKKEKALPLPIIEDGEKVTIKEVNKVDKKTSPPKYFNDGNIEMAMKNISRFIVDDEVKKLLNENEGIGEESTRSNIVKLLKNRNYIEIISKNLRATKTGMAIIDSVEGDIKSPVKTAMMERQLKEIENGNLSVDSYIETQISYTKEIIESSNNATFEGLPKKEKGVKCPQCEDGIQYQKKSTHGIFWGCSDYDSGCKKSYPDIEGKPYIKKIKCDCGEGELGLFGGKHGSYFKCPECLNTASYEKGKPVFTKYLDNYECPKCQSKLSIKISKAKKEFFPCSSSKCEFAAFKNKKLKLTYKENDKWEILSKK